MDLADEPLHARGTGGSESAMPAAAIGSDDVLREILLCLGLPAFLVRAALVSKRWFCVAADPAFLRLFRDRHPPRLLGFYVGDKSMRPRFVPVSDAAEHRATVSRADSYRPVGLLCDCRNGRLLLQPFTFGEYVVLSPLCPTQDVVHVPMLPDGVGFIRLKLYWFSYNLCDDGNSLVFVALWLDGQKLSVKVCVLQSGAWGEVMSVEGEIPAPFTDIHSILVVHGKLYVVTNRGYIHGLDFVDPYPQLFNIQLPDEVDAYVKLSYRHDSGLFLIHGDGFHLSLWHHKTTDDNGEDSWELVDRFLVRAAHDRRNAFRVVRVGEDAEFVFLVVSESIIICVNLRSKEETVHDMTKSYLDYVNVFPLMTVWPPIFPALSDQHDHSLMKVIE